MSIAGLKLQTSCCLFMCYPEVVRQKKFLTAKFGRDEDEPIDDEEDEEEEEKLISGGRRHNYHDADNKDFEVMTSTHICLLPFIVSFHICMCNN